MTGDKSKLGSRLAEVPANGLYTGVPTLLREFPNFVCWKSEERGGKRTKIPYRPDGHKAKANDPNTWCSYDQALKAVKADPSFDGLGFVFSKDAGITGIDLDDCYDENGALLPAAASKLPEREV